MGDGELWPLLGLGSFGWCTLYCLFTIANTHLFIIFVNKITLMKFFSVGGFSDCLLLIHKYSTGMTFKDNKVAGNTHTHFKHKQLVAQDCEHMRNCYREWTKQCGNQLIDRTVTLRQAREWIIHCTHACSATRFLDFGFLSYNSKTIHTKGRNFHTVSRVRTETSRVSGCNRRNSHAQRYYSAAIENTVAKGG